MILVAGGYLQQQQSPVGDGQSRSRVLTAARPGQLQQSCALGEDIRAALLQREDL